MREIKFRVFSKESTKPTDFDRMYYSSQYESMSEFWREVENIRDDLEEGFSGDYHVMQYTGLKDKNGKEIYEGDIRKGKYYFQSEEQTHYQVMKWDEANACFYWDGPEIPDFVGVEVIGNVWENPELIRV